MTSHPLPPTHPRHNHDNLFLHLHHHRRHKRVSVRPWELRHLSRSTHLVKRMQIDHRLRSSVYGHNGCVNTVLWNHDGRLIISGGDDQCINVWNAMDASVVHSHSLAHTAAEHVEGDDDDDDDDDDWDDVLMGGHEQDTTSSSSGNSGIVAQIRTRHSGNIFYAAFLPFTNDSQIVSCAADGDIRVFDLNKSSGSGSNTCASGDARVFLDTQVCVRVFRQHRSMVHKLALEPGNPHVFLSCSNDGTSMLFDLRMRERSYRPDVLVDLRHSATSSHRGISHAFRHETVEINSISISERNPHMFVIGGGDPNVRIYDRRMTASGHHSRLQCVAQFAPQEVLDTERYGDRLIPMHITGVRYCGFTNRVLASYSGDSVYLFDVDTGTMGNSNSSDPCSEYVMKYEGHRNIRTVKEVSFFGPRNEYVISGSDCGRVFFWETETGRLINLYKGDRHIVNALAPHPEGAPILATSGIEYDVKVWLPSSDRLESRDIAHVDQIMATNRRRTENQMQIQTALPAGLIFNLLTVLEGGNLNGDDSDDDGDNEEQSESEQEEFAQSRRRRIRLVLSRMGNYLQQMEEGNDGSSDEDDENNDSSSGGDMSDEEIEYLEFEEHDEYGEDDSRDSDEYEYGSNAT